MEICFVIKKKESDTDFVRMRDLCVSVSLDDEGLVNWLIFKDTTNGKKYKLQVTNGAVELVEVT